METENLKITTGQKRVVRMLSSVSEGEREEIFHDWFLAVRTSSELQADYNLTARQICDLIDIEWPNRSKYMKELQR